MSLLRPEQHAYIVNLPFNSYENDFYDTVSINEICANNTAGLMVQNGNGAENSDLAF